MKIVSLIAVLAAATVWAAPAEKDVKAPIKWTLRLTEDFKGTKLDEKLWTRIDKGNPDWMKKMSLRPDLVTVKGGQLHCWGKKNDDLSADPRTHLTGGVMTKDRFAMKYGKVEFKMKLENGQKGAWPAVWMMPQTVVHGWPNDGEIDIVERLNSDDFVYQTLHHGDGSGKKDFPIGGKGKIKKGDWNVYGLEWTPESLVWTVNGVETFRHDKPAGADAFKYPWSTPFYLMIDMQLGGNWVGSVDESTLPVAMHVDWVKFYEGSRGGKKFSEFVKPKSKKK